MSEVKEALKDAGGAIDLIGFDACLMGMVEVAYQIKDYAAVAVFSQEGEPWDGWPYDTIMADLTAKPAMPADELGEIIVRRYGESYDEPGITQSAVDLRDFGALTKAIDRFAGTLDYNWDEFSLARNKTDSGKCRDMGNVGTVHR